MKKRFFITATGTNIGKTFISAALVQQAKALGKSVAAYKPVVSGIDEATFVVSDTAALLRALDLFPTPENIERISPWRYTAPLAPSMAARLEGKTLDFNAVTQWSRKMIEGPEDTVVIEGVGGVMVPMDERHTVLDWMVEMAIPALLVTGSYLGTISHTLTALTVMEQRKISVAGLIVNETVGSPVMLDSTVQELARWTKAPIVKVTRRDEADGWKNVPELRDLLS